MAATSIRLSMFSLVPTSSCLTIHISQAVAMLSPLMSHLSFASVGLYLLFQVLQLQSLLQVWRTRSTHTLLSTSLALAFCRAGSSVPESLVSHVLAGR